MVLTLLIAILLVVGVLFLIGRQTAKTYPTGIKSQNIDDVTVIDLLRALADEVSSKPDMSVAELVNRLNDISGELKVLCKDKNSPVCDILLRDPATYIGSLRKTLQDNSNNEELAERLRELVETMEKLMDKANQVRSGTNR